MTLVSTTNIEIFLNFHYLCRRDMKALKRISVAIAMAVAILVAGSCSVSKIKDIKLVSAGVKYVVPTSLRSLDAMLVLGIDNPAMTFNVSNVEGAIRVDDRPFAVFTAGEMQIQGKQTLAYELPCTVILEPDISLLDLLKLAGRRSLDGIKADVNLNVASKNGKLQAPLKYKDIDLAEFSK